MTVQLIRSGLSNQPSSPVRTKVECCKSCDFFGCQVMDCSATRIPSSSIMGQHPQSTVSLNGGGGLILLQRGTMHILQPQPTGRTCLNSSALRQVACYIRTMLFWVENSIQNSIMTIGTQKLPCVAITDWTVLKNISTTKTVCIGLGNDSNWKINK